MTNESERAKFEAWVASELGKGYACTTLGEECDPHWEGWKARAQSSGAVVSIEDLQKTINGSTYWNLITELRNLIAKHTGSK